MSKDNAVSLLREQGFKADSIGGVVYIESDNERDFKRGGTILKKSGYTDSFGWKKEQGSEA